MKKRAFPVFANEPTCFKSCDSRLGNIQTSGHAPGSGAYVGKCPKCGMMTWFDRPAIQESKK